MLPDDAFYFFGKEPGAGGLPTGTGGRVACLLSGGIDSPVAAYRMMRRGCSVLLIHFHSYPILSRASQEKVREIAALLTRYQLRSRLVLVPFGELQQQVVLAVPPELRVVIYRRLMLRIAERLARRWRARALVTGEVVGQVASQTLENLTTIGGATTLEILRPLVGMDKDEIVEQAQKLGTFPISIIPDQDCCQLFTPRASGDEGDTRSDRRSRAGAADRRDGRCSRRRQQKSKTSGDRDRAAQIDVLNRVQQADAFLHRALERLAAGDQPHAAGALVDHRGLDGFLQVALARRCAARVDQAGAAHVAVGDLIARQVDRVVAS